MRARSGKSAIGSLIALTALTALSAVCGTSTRAEAAELSDERLAAIITRVLAFDRNLKDRSGATLTVGVLATPSGRASGEIVGIVASFSRLRDMTVQGLPLRVIALDWDGRSPLAPLIQANHVNALFVAKGLEPQLDELARLCRDLKVLSFAADADYLRRGLSAGVFDEGGRPKIYINLEASRGEGASFLPELLQLAKIVER